MRPRAVADLREVRDGEIDNLRLPEQRMSGFPLPLEVVGEAMQLDQCSGHLIALYQFPSALQLFLLSKRLKRVRNIPPDQIGTLISHIDQKH